MRTIALLSALLATYFGPTWWAIPAAFICIWAILDPENWDFSNRSNKPMTREVGQRIGAMIDTNPDTRVVRFAGYGTYEGNEVPPEDIGGFNIGLPNPKLKLDSGEICWGCEVWWGSEESIKAALSEAEANGYTIKSVTMAEARKEEADGADNDNEHEEEGV